MNINNSLFLFHQVTSKMSGNMQFVNHNPSLVLQVTDRTHIFLLEAVRKRPQDSARHHAVVHPLSPSVGRDGGLPSGGHLFPPAGHLLELHQSNVSQRLTFVFFFSFASSLSRRIFFLSYNYLLSHRTLSRLARTHLAAPSNSDALEMPRNMLLCEQVYIQVYPVFVGGYRAQASSLFRRKKWGGGEWEEAKLSLNMYTRKMQRARCTRANHSEFR